MKPLRILVHGLVLLISDYAGIFLGFLAFHYSGSRDQITVQLPVAVVVSIAFYLIWSVLPRVASFLKSLALSSTSEFAWTYVASLAAGPIVFVPLHYFTQGYLTDIENLVSLFLFQVPVNAAAIGLAWKMTRAPISSAAL